MIDARRLVSYVESDVPSDLTLRQWRRMRQADVSRPARRRRGLRTLGRRIQHPTGVRRPRP